MLHHISLYLRKIKGQKRLRQECGRFSAHKQHIENTFAVLPEKRGVVLVKLDDIGDYILFRNMIHYYVTSYADQPFYLVGNSVWKSIWEAMDKDARVQVIWVDKQQYFQKDDYRTEIWRSIHQLNCYTAIAPSVSRSLMLDDLCILASGALVTIGAHLIYEQPEHISLSNACYSQLVPIPPNTAEFIANKNIASAILQVDIADAKPNMPLLQRHSATPYMCVFIGANAISRRWTAVGWVTLIKEIQKRYPELEIKMIGGPNDEALALHIMGQLGSGKVRSYVGKCSLIDSVAMLQHAVILVSNNSMAYHVSTASGVPTVLLTNGENAYRFTTYDTLLYPNVSVIYPPRFSKVKPKYQEPQDFKFYPVKRDIQEIQASSVLDAIERLRVLS